MASDAEIQSLRRNILDSIHYIVDYAGILRYWTKEDVLDYINEDVVDLLPPALNGEMPNDVKDLFRQAMVVIPPGPFADADTRAVLYRYNSEVSISAPQQGEPLLRIWPGIAAGMAMQLMAVQLCQDPCGQIPDPDLRRVYSQAIEQRLYDVIDDVQALHNAHVELQRSLPTYMRAKDMANLASVNSLANRFEGEEYLARRIASYVSRPGNPIENRAGNYMELQLLRNRIVSQLEAYARRTVGRQYVRVWLDAAKKAVRTSTTPDYDTAVMRGNEAVDTAKAALGGGGGASMTF